MSQHKLVIAEKPSVAQSIAKALGVAERKDGIDLIPFGTHLEEQEKGVYTANGYLLPSGDEWEKVFEKERVLKPYVINNYLETAEMSTEQNYNQKSVGAIQGGAAVWQV